MVGVAVKATEAPAHTGFWLATRVTLGVTSGLTVMVTVLEVAGLPEMHPVRDEVITTYIWSPFASEEFV